MKSIPGAGRVPLALCVLLLSGGAAVGPAAAVSLDPVAAQAAAQDMELVRAHPIDARQLQLDADLDLAGVIAPRAAHAPGAMNGALRHAHEDDASWPAGAGDELAGELLPGLALSAAPLVDYGSDRNSGPSVVEVLRSVVTLSGERRASWSARASANRGRGGESVLGMLQPLAVELLEASLTDRRMIDGTVVFSILGRGAFVAEAARDGSGLVLSELRSGFGMVLGRDPALRRPESRAEPWEPQQTVPVQAHWHAASAPDDGSLRWLIDATLGVLHGLVRAVIWVATTPLVLAIAVPVLLVVMLIGAVRRVREAPPEAVAATRAAAVCEDPAGAGAQPVRRRHPRRRGTWSMLLGQVRESIGFPDQDTLRGGDLAAHRGRASRPSPKSA